MEFLVVITILRIPAVIRVCLNNSGTTFILVQDESFILRLYQEFYFPEK